MRNTIHGASLTAMAYQNGIDPEKSYVQIPNADAQVIWDICGKYDSVSNWGLLNFSDMMLFEPYTFSQKLLSYTIEIVNTIASLTQVEKLFPLGTQIPQLVNGPPANDLTFDSKIGERLVLLAWIG